MINTFIYLRCLWAEVLFVSLICRMDRLGCRALAKVVGGWMGDSDGCSELSAPQEWRQGIEVGCGEEKKLDGGISLDFGDGGGTGRSVKKFGDTCLVGDKCEVGWRGGVGYLHPCRWATHWTGRSWQQVSVQDRKHHLWGSPAHCRLTTSSWWSWEEDVWWDVEEEWESEREGERRDEKYIMLGNVWTKNET